MRITRNAAFRVELQLHEGQLQTGGHSFCLRGDADGVRTGLEAPELRFTTTGFNSYVSMADGAPRRADGPMAVSTAPGLGVMPRERVLATTVVNLR